ncbi:MAG: hypothetical protein AAF846_25575 [Chloroflexota bacterium]
MLCPICDADIVIVGQTEADMDYCPECEATVGNHAQVERVLDRYRSRHAKITKKSPKMREGRRRKKQNQRFRQERSNKEAFYEADAY